jgi:membrane protein DedA with SNARE-associated domain
VLAHDGQLDIVLVVVIAAAAAIIGDNVGYVIGRTGGRRLLEHHALPFEHHRREALERGGRFFERHGAKAVFLGRWFAGLRIAAAWLAGMNHMRWTVFLFWNALGGIVWAVAVGVAAYLAGHVVAKAFGVIGVGGVVLVVVALVVFGVLRWAKRRRPASVGRD